MTRCLVTALIFSLAAPLQAGVFSKADLDQTEPFIVMHPTVYNGTGGDLTLSICASSPEPRPAVREAIRIWNAQTATTENCRNCWMWEEPNPMPPRPPMSFSSTILHELGHCAMGLGHTNWQATSFTNSQMPMSIAEGSDMIRGSRDDVPTPLPGTRLIHWFRIADNNPVLIDATVIDESTYSRRILDLPPGSSWPANANRCVSDALLGPVVPGDPCPIPPSGTDRTQAVMYSGITYGMRLHGLVADDVSTSSFSMTGLDLEAGTADDYTLTLVYESDCTQADIRVDYVPITEPGTIAICSADFEPIGQAPTQIHYRLTAPVPLFSQIVVEVDVDQEWDLLHVDDFESGNASRWDAVVP